MALPYTIAPVSPFDVILAITTNQMISNIESLAAGTGFNTGAIPTGALANGAVTSSKINLGAQTLLTPASVGTTSTSYVDLTGGPAVTATIGTNGMALVIVTSLHYNNTAAQDVFHSFRVSGATTIASADANATSSNGTPGITASTATLVTGLTAGSNTFTSQYKAGGSTANFLRRSITVIPL